ncbi:hypothetical protein [Mycobacterium intracellulare]|uniref:Uncharacterized protein n=1 Tax=Mycobacterium intracellulare TaxID=1767 RepID=A0A7R7RQW3_MYCIT|nr:hypothetical protein [Mycobacterium intracellulare]BCP00701.1 hypothetical protein MINTM018_34700 [Mycobacterium intracellulare]
MKLLGRKHVPVEARPFDGGNVPLVRLALGYDVFVMDTDEAIALASQLVAAVDDVREGAPDGGS